MSNENNSKDVFNVDDTLDINELASLNDDISPEFIEQLQNKVAQNASEFTGRSVDSLTDDSNLFEEVQKQDSKPALRINIDENIDDNFIKKYKAKLNKQQVDLNNQSEDKKKKATDSKTTDEEQELINSSQIEASNDTSTQKKEIKELSGGNIVEKPVKKEQIEYNETLDLADNNIKYSKYVIYIDPENTEFMDSLTVKERKNLINRIIREQDDIALTKRRLNIVKNVLKHTVVAVITIAIAIPISYWIVNASLEATIDNYKRSKTAFKTLYREKGKIKTKSSY